MMRSTMRICQRNWPVASKSVHQLRYGRRHESTVRYDQEEKLARHLEPKYNEARPYRDIPGPKPFPLLGNVPRFIPGIGEYGNVPLMKTISMLRDKYGDIVKLEGIPGQRRVVFLFDPNSCKEMYRYEGVWPKRIAMESLQYYREKTYDIYGINLGLASSQGEQWHAFRTKVNQHLMRPDTIRPHVTPIDDVASDFIDKIRHFRDPRSLEMPASFNNEVNKWALESICVIAFDQRMGCLEKDLPSDSEPQVLVDSVHKMFDLMYKMEVLPSLWKIYETRNLKKFIRTMDTLTGITSKYVIEAKKRLKSDSTNVSGEKGMLERLLSVDENVATVMVMDMLAAGVDTTSNSASAAMYYLSTNPEVQEKLRAEAIQVLPTKESPVTFDALNKTPYLKAVIKESMRLMPIAIGNLRTMISDVVVCGYRIPKGENVIMAHSVISCDPRHFPRHLEFLPERWLKDTRGVPSAKDANPFAYMPFGFGPRSCIGKRFAQLELETLLMKVARNFSMEWHHEPMKFESRFINTIGSPLRIKFTDL